MSKKVSGAEFQLSKIFSSEFIYEIPGYQRPYAWTVDQASELFDDLFDFYSNEKDDGYFLGSIVLIKEDGNPHAEVIDGQQRLTTLTILLAAMASIVTEQSKKNQFIGYLCEPGNELEGLSPLPRLTLRERDKDFFGKYVQGIDFDGIERLDTQQIKVESQINVRNNAILLRDRLLHHFGRDDARLMDFGKFLLQRCFLVAVWTPNQQSAFRVFSVMNSRGLDLQPTDIIKADVIGKIDESNRDDFRDRWEEMEISLGRQGFNDLFAYVRMICAKEKARRSLLEEFRNHVLPVMGHPPERMVETLESYADGLVIVKKAQYTAVSDADDVNYHLTWLNRIDNNDWVPPVLHFLKRRMDSPKQVAQFIKMMERLASFMHICAYNVNDRIERYGKIIRELDQVGVAMPSGVDLTPSEQAAFIKSLDGNIYEMTARRRNYVILRLDSFCSDGAATYDHSILTIEHVLPQTVEDGSEWAQWWPDPLQRWTWVHRIANLVPLNFKRNAKASNYKFDRKKSAYFGGTSQVSSFVLTTQVLQTTEWTPAHVEGRQKSLMDSFKANWNLTATAL